MIAIGCAALLTSLSLLISLPLTLLSLLLVVSSHRSVRVLLGFLVAVVPAMLMTVLLHGLFPVAGLQPFAPSVLLTGMQYACRLAGFSALIFFLLRTTDSDALARGIATLFRPLQRYLPMAGDLLFALTLAIRCIPLVHAEFNDLLLAHRMRGLVISGGVHRQSVIAARLLIAAIRAAAVRADQFALAAVARGYSSGRERSTFYRYELRLHALLLLACWTALCLGLAAFARFAA